MVLVRGAPADLAERGQGGLAGIGEGVQVPLRGRDLRVPESLLHDLAIGAARSHALREEVGHGCDGVKPGWARVNLNYFISPATADYIAAAVELIAADGYRLLPGYRLNPHTGLWHHHNGPPRPQITLHEVTYGQEGGISYPRHHGLAGEEAFAGYLRQARALFDRLPRHVDDGPTGLSPEFEALRWFPLPPACLPAHSAETAVQP